MKFFYYAIIITILSNCAYYPKQVEVYDQDCNIQFKKLILQRSDSNMSVSDCENEACIASLLSIPMQALVAGSVVIAGNAVYWLEKEGKCVLRDNKQTG